MFVKALSLAAVKCEISNRLSCVDPRHVNSRRRRRVVVYLTPRPVALAGRSTLLVVIIHECRFDAAFKQKRSIKSAKRICRSCSNVQYDDDLFYLPECLKCI